MSHLKSRRVLIGLGAIVSLALAGAAIAYFTSTGSGTGTASVGNASNWTVNVATPSGGPLYPGAGSQTFQYTVTNAGSGHQQLNATATSVPGDANGDILTSGAPQAGCKAIWFTAANTPVAPTNLAGGASVTSSVTVTMQDSNTNQNACQGKSPDVKVDAS
jgi:hypothetical protein